MYCSSPDRGKGCRYAPHGVHFHPSDSTKCAYCGSPNYGRGCKLNPTADLHIHGVNYNNMFRESIQSFLDNSVLIRELKKDFNKFSAYKLGIIDDRGNKIKTPVTEQEQMSYTPFVKTIIKLKRYLGSKIELLEASSLLKQNSTPINESVEKYKKVLEYQDRIDSVVDELYKTLDEAHQAGLPLEDIKRLIRA
jgi:hypothetical protein